MSLTSQLAMPHSPVSTLLAARLDLPKAARFIQSQNDELACHPPLIVAGADPALAGSAFRYAFAWFVRPLRNRAGFIPTLGAKRIERAYPGAVRLLEWIINRGNDQPAWRPALAVALALFEQAARSGEAPVLLDIWLNQLVDTTTMDSFRLEPRYLLSDDNAALLATISDVQQLAATIPQVWEAHLPVAAWTPCPTFAGSPDVGGADANGILNGMLLDIRCTRKQEPFDLHNLRQQIMYAVLDYQDTYHIHSLAWYYARQRCLIVYPLAHLVHDIARLRADFQDFIPQGDSVGDLYEDVTYPALD